eukprot:gene6194-57865_t
MGKMRRSITAHPDQEQAIYWVDERGTEHEFKKKGERWEILPVHRVGTASARRAAHGSPWFWCSVVRGEQVRCRWSVIDRGRVFQVHYAS